MGIKNRLRGNRKIILGKLGFLWEDLCGYAFVLCPGLVFQLSVEVDHERQILLTLIENLIDPWWFAEIMGFPFSFRAAGGNKCVMVRKQCLNT